MVDFPITVVIDPKKAKEGAKQVENSLVALENEAGKLNNLIAQTFGFIGISIGARKILELANTYANLQNRLRVVTGSQEELNDVSQRLFEIATKTRSEFGPLVELYSRLANSTKQLGLSQQELFQFTERLNQAVILSGASATEASAGLTQLAQGLASGALRGDELRSVLEQLPAVAQTIAKGLGVSLGELRKLGGEGKLTAEAVITAFKNAGNTLEGDFGKTVPTVGQAMSSLNNSLLQFVGTTDQAVGATTILARTISFTADNVGTLAIGVTFLSSVMTASLVKGAFPAVIKGLTAIRTLALSNPFVLLATGIVGATVALKEFNSVLDDTNKANKLVETGNLTEFGKIGDRMVNARKEIERIKKVLEKSPENEAALNLLKQAEARLAGLAGESKKVTEQFNKQREATIKQNTAFRDMLLNLQQEQELLKLSSRERDIREKLLKVEETILKAGGDLTGSARQQIETQVRANAALAEQAEVLNSIRQPIEDYQNRLTILQKLLADGTIKQSEFNQAVSDLGVPAALQVGPQPAPGFEPEQDPAESSVADSNLRINQANITLTQQQIDLLDQLQQSQIEYNTTIADLTALRNADAISVEEYSRLTDEALLRQLEGITSLEAGYDRFFVKLRLEAEDTASVIEATFNRFLDAGTEALVQFAETGKVEFGDLARSVISDLLRIYARMLLIQAISAFSPGAGAAAGALTPRAEGGTVQPGRGYMVGELGPEPFYPDRTGTIAPATAPAATPAVNLQVVNVDDPKNVPQAIANGSADESLVNFVRRNRGKINRELGND